MTQLLGAVPIRRRHGVVGASGTGGSVRGRWPGIVCTLTPVTNAAGESGGRSRLPWVVGGVVVVGALLVGGFAFALSSGGQDPTTVSGVADAAVQAAEELDVDAAIDLLCSPPGGDDRAFLDGAISAARDATGDESPDVTYEVSHVVGGAEGGFDVVITSGDDALAGVVGTAHVTVQQRGDRSCISGWDDTSIDQQGDGEYVVE